MSQRKKCFEKGRHHELIVPNQKYLKYISKDICYVTGVQVHAPQWSADKAVDGVADPDTLNDFCAQMNTPDGGPSVWLVDLGEPHVIEEVKVLNRIDTDGDESYERMTNVTAYVSSFKSLNYNEHEKRSKVCGRFPDMVQPASWLTLTCDKNTIGRYVIFRNGENAPHRAKMSICEAVVMGYKPFSCDSCVGGCDPLTGCKSCPPGRALPDCKQCELYSIAIILAT